MGFDRLNEVSSQSKWNVHTDTQEHNDTHRKYTDTLHVPHPNPLHLTHKSGNKWKGKMGEREREHA